MFMFNGEMDVKELSQYIVAHCYNNGNPISNVELQYILYAIQKKYIRNKSLAFDDAIEAWKVGPVVPDSYYYFCGWGSMPITFPFDSSVSGVTKQLIDPIIDRMSKMEWYNLYEDIKDNSAWARKIKEIDSKKSVIEGRYPIIFNDEIAVYG